MAYHTKAEIAEFRRRAEEARKLANRAATPSMREGFLRVAQEWDELIKKAEEPSAARN
jgi:hypothetical protein